MTNSATTLHDLVPSAKPRHVLDELDDALGRERSTRRKVRELVKPTPDKGTLRVSRQARGRRTGWAVSCSEHGVLPFLIPKRKAARAAAIDHAQREHPEGATLVVEGG